jgi:hypothetical protein
MFVVLLKELVGFFIDLFLVGLKIGEFFRVFPIFRMFLVFFRVFF